MNQSLRTFSIARGAEAVRDSTFGTISSGTFCMNCRLAGEVGSGAGSSLALPAFTATCLLPPYFRSTTRICSLWSSRKDQTSLVILTRVFVQTAPGWARQHVGSTRVHLRYRLPVSLGTLDAISCADRVLRSLIWRCRRVFK